ncbi:endonuclease/exonuclease/phosphatase family protein [Candidatus Saccharibacteria bacterium]|nr:endonuclease/exonuclease/phosphatase family protein [Candidatus Saccharibacteria bacterium]
MRLKLLQWNVWYKENAENILKFIGQIDADVVCLQELTQDSSTNPKIDIPALIGELGYESHYFQTLTEKNCTMGNAIFSKHPLTNKSIIYTHRGKDLPSYDASYADEPRAYLEADIHVANRILHVGSVHLSYCHAFKPSPQRQQENDTFVKAVSRHDQSLIFSGDFNAVPENELIQSLNKQFKHAGPDFSEKTWTTKPFSYDGFDTNTLDWRLDYVFCTRDIKILSSRIIPTDFSDHLPILVEFEI